MKNEELSLEAPTSRSINQIAEIWYGSYTVLLDTKVSNKSEEAFLYKLICDRFDAITYLVDHQIFSSITHKTEIDNLMKLIINEMENTEQNISKQHVAGEQSEIFLVKEVIMSSPFESLMKLNSTRGRLFVVMNWEKFTQLPNFKYQEYYSDLFGFKCKEGSLGNSK